MGPVGIGEDETRGLVKKDPSIPLLKIHTGRVERPSRYRLRKAVAPFSQWPPWTALPTTAAPKAEGSGAASAEAVMVS